MNRIGHDTYVDLINYLAGRKQELIDNPPKMSELAKQVKEGLGVEISPSSITQACKRLEIITVRSNLNDQDRALQTMRTKYEELEGRVKELEGKFILE